MVIDANLVPAIVDALARAEFRTQKEAAWAVSNFTVGGTPEQVSSLCVCVCVCVCVNAKFVYGNNCCMHPPTFP